MKQVVFLSFSIFLAIAGDAYAHERCPIVEYEDDYNRKLPINDPPDVITGFDPLTPNGIVKCTIGLEFGKEKSWNRLSRGEMGTLEGAKYGIFFSDASGSIQGTQGKPIDLWGGPNLHWTTRCEFDEFDDRYWCALLRGNLTVGIWKDGTYFLSVGRDHYPGSELAVRIDKNRPIMAYEKTGFTQAQSAAVISQMGTGGRIVTRYQEWPYENNKVEAFGLFGFKQAWEILEIIYGRVGQDAPY